MRRAAPGSLALVLVLAGCGATGPSPAAAPPGTHKASFRFSGFTHASWWHDEYPSADGQASRAALASTRASWAGVLVTWYMQTPDSNLIARDTLRTPDDDAVVAAISDLHSRGLKVMLKPHVDVEDGTWRGTITPTDPAAWFSSYRAFLTRYAALAEANHVEMFAVGTELATMSGSSYASEWGTTIALVRGAYSGLLTYAANAVTSGDEFTSVSFWQALDVAGLDAYAPLSAATEPSVAELVSGWSAGPDGDDMLAAFRNFEASIGKPVIFTEVGYKSVAGAASAPWNFDLQGGYDAGVQANCYEAAFETFASEPWFSGLFFWDWEVPPPGALDTGYSPRGKPAESIFEGWQP